jgi:hypothetical protein
LGVETRLQVVRDFDLSLMAMTESILDTLKPLHPLTERIPIVSRSVQFADRGESVLVFYLESHQVYVLYILTVHVALTRVQSGLQYRAFQEEMVYANSDWDVGNQFNIWQHDLTAYLSVVDLRPFQWING